MKDKIKELYEKYNTRESRDKWEVASKIVNDLVNRNDYHEDPTYVYHLKTTWHNVEEFIREQYTMPHKKHLTITLKDSKLIILPLTHEPLTNDWVLRIPDYTVTDISYFLENGYYALDETSTIRITNE